MRRIARSRTIVAISVSLAFACAACRVAPHAADPRAPVKRVDARLVNAQRVRIERLSVNGARIPERAWERALATLRSCVTGEIEVVERAPLALPADEHGVLRAPFAWPVCTDAELASGVVVERELVPGAWLELARDGAPIALAALDPDGGRNVLPVVAPNVLLVAVLARDHDERGLHGWCTPLQSEAPGGVLAPSGSLIVLQADAIEARASWFASAATLAEHTLVHEFGHALGLPADPRRAWIGPHFGTHCTHPECALYPAFDWRSFLSGVAHGWPLEFCAACRAKLAAARAGGAASVDPDVARR